MQIQYLEGQFRLESHLQKIFSLAKLEWPPGGHHLVLPSTQCDEVQMAYVTIEDGIKKRCNLDIGDVEMSQPADATRFDAKSICRQNTLLLPIQI